MVDNNIASELFRTRNRASSARLGSNFQLGYAEILSIPASKSE